MHRIEAGRLIPGHGGPVSDGVVVLDGARNSYAGPAGVAPATPGTPVTRVATVMPGMWECSPTRTGSPRCGRGGGR